MALVASMAAGFGAPDASSELSLQSRVSHMPSWSAVGLATSNAPAAALQLNVRTLFEGKRPPRTASPAARADGIGLDRPILGSFFNGGIYSGRGARW